MSPDDHPADSSLVRVPESGIARRASPKGGGLVRRVSWWVVDHIAGDIRRVEAPRIAGDLAQLNPVSRAIECLSYAALRLEHALAPNNWLRALLLTMLRIVLAVTIPVLALYLISIPLEWISGSFATIASHIEAMFLSVLHASIYAVQAALVLVGGVAAILLLIKFLKATSPSSKPSRR